MSDSTSLFLNFKAQTIIIAGALLFTSVGAYIYLKKNKSKNGSTSDADNLKKIN